MTRSPLIWIRRGTIAAVLLMAIALTGCQGMLTKTEAAPTSRLIISTLSDPKTFNYVLNTESPNVFDYIYEGLVRENGETGEIEPALAESWTITPDNQRIIFTLREGLRWSDGEPLTVEDVVFTYNELYFNTAIPTSLRDILKIGQGEMLPTVRQLDQRRVEFVAPEPFAPLLRNTGIAILPAHALRESVQTLDADGTPQFLTHWGSDTPAADIVANGAYRLASYAPSERVIFERNPYYWRKDPQGNHQPYVERLIWQIVESTDSALIQFRSGGLDMLGIAPDYFALLKREETRGKFTIHNGGAAPGTTFITFNLNQGNRQGVPLVDPVRSRWFNQVAFRQAIAHAINRPQMLNNVFRGLGSLQNSPISVQSPYYFAPEEGLPVYNYDPDQSRMLLQNAGFQYNTQGQLLDAEGHRVRFTLITNAGNKIREAMGAQIKRDLSQIGIQVDFNPIAFSTLLEKLSNTLDWEAYLLGFTGGVEPNGGANVWLPNGRSHRFNQAAQPGQPAIEGRVVSDWETRIGQLYVAGAKNLDEGQRKAIYAESQRLTQENLPFIYLVNPLSLSAVRDRVQPIKFSALGGALWNLYELDVQD